jgi:hypothetical protein
MPNFWSSPSPGDPLSVPLIGIAYVLYVVLTLALVIVSQRRAFWSLYVVLLIVLGLNVIGWQVPAHPQPAQAPKNPLAVEIEEIGGVCAVDQARPDKPVIGVYVESNSRITDAWLTSHIKDLTKLQFLNLTNTKVTDAGLEHFEGLTELKLLNLTGTAVTGAGLKHLKGMTHLESLVLRGTKVSDAGLEHLKGLTQLWLLDLQDTKVSDAGLEHLKGLTHCRISLFNTKVTDAGAQRLQQALPKWRIEH